jgi:hypothetical protein
LLSAIDGVERGTYAKFFTCTAYNDAVLLCNTQELVAAEKLLAVTMTVSKYLSPEDHSIAKRVEKTCAFASRRFAAFADSCQSDTATLEELASQPSQRRSSSS